MTASAPSPDELSLGAQLLEFLRSWGGPLFGGSGLGIAYFAGRKFTSIEGACARNAETLRDHDEHLRILEAARAAADIRIAELPTQARLDAAMERLQSQMQAGFAQVTQLIGGRSRD